MALAIDAVSSSAQTGNGLAEWSHTCSGANRALIVVVARGDTGGTVDVHFGLQAMTEVTNSPRTLPVDGDEIRMYRLENPAATTDTIQVSASSNNSLACGAISFTGADQTNCVRGTSTATGTSAAPSVTVSSAAGDIVVGGVAAFGSRTWTQGTNETEQWDVAHGANMCCWGGTEAGAASVTIAPTQSGSNEWGIIAASIQPAAGGGGAAAITASPFTLTGIQ